MIDEGERHSADRNKGLQPAYSLKLVEGEFCEVHFHDPEKCWPIGPGFRLSLRREALKTTLRVAVVHKDAL